MKNMDFKSYIRDIQDFPKEGVVFKDITPLLKNGEALNQTVSALLELLDDKKIDKVVGMESRGFFFAPLLASKLGAGFVPVRKPGKLPAKTLQQSYDLEYGTDMLEVHQDSIAKGDKILVHDDVLATGGTAFATCELIERLGGEIVQCNFLIELTFLNGASKLNEYPTKSLIKY
ncbi:adenine phosphoribosyltransferase [Cytophaga sp. FL35]|uniref:adenine phosphoribosyltransferase n=1 Tax=Cytophaga sp. FL35 TaxID=1904456 RepID=UPI001CA46DA4|nr:adenine phosphoribosyltransferase [Cytophaga sp. FL35]